MKFGVIGCGNMATALVAGAVKSGVIPSGDLVACNRTQSRLDAFVAQTGATTAADAREIGARCDVILLCTKPYDILKVLAEADEGTNGQPRLAISVAAGLSLAQLESAVPKNFRIIRCMPNTPSLVGHGAAAFCRGTHATEADAALAQQLLASVGLSIEVPERLMDAVTGLSGSGPAYGYMIIEALADAGVRHGLPRADAIKLAAQTMLGAAAMVLETGDHPAVLKDRVTSPGGTTIAGLAALEQHGLRAALLAAVAASAQRSAELGRH